MKYLYIWNDLKLLNKKKDIIVEGMIREFIDYMNSVNQQYCEYHLLSSAQLLKWIEHIQQVCKSQHCITIGKRPSEIAIEDAYSVNRIMLQRTIDKSGYTSGVAFKNQTECVLNEYIEKFDIMHFVEDVTVNGTTLLFIADYLQEKQFNGKCVFHIFSSNEIALNKLMSKQRGFEIEVDTEYYMKGKPIEASTLLCLCDLLYEKLGNDFYINRLDLMKFFFFDETDKLVETVHQIKEYINV